MRSTRRLYSIRKYITIEQHDYVVRESRAALVLTHACNCFLRLHARIIRELGMDGPKARRETRIFPAGECFQGRLCFRTHTDPMQKGPF